MNYNLALANPTAATIPTVPTGALVGAGASAGYGRVIIESRQHVAARHQIRSLVPGEFKKQEKKWIRETLYSSSLTDKYLHPSYARIIGMGLPVVPLILQSLEKEPNDWFYALRAITGANPVRSKDAGYMQKMSQAWLSWGRKRGLCA